MTVKRRVSAQRLLTRRRGWVNFQLLEKLQALRPADRAPCKSAPVTGRRRCRMHGGADGSGAPKGARNGNYKHGRYTKEVAATRWWLREAIHTLHELKKRP